MVDDWSIQIKFPQVSQLPFRVSPFLTDPQVNVDHFGLPDDFFACQHETPINLPENREERDLDRHDWDMVLFKLELEDTNLVVLNTKDSNPPPHHPRIIDLRGKTTLRESISILTRASAYVGIASSLCVLASQIFDKDHLWVKGPEHWLWINRYIYFAPHQTFPFLHKKLYEPAIEDQYKGMVEIAFLYTRFWQNQICPEGSPLFVTEANANDLIKRGCARLYKFKEGGSCQDLSTP